MIQKGKVLRNFLFQPIERKTRRFNTLKIPKALQAELPFSSKPKQLKAQRKQTYAAKRAVLLEPEEKKVYTMMQQLNSLRKDKERKRKAKDMERRAENIKKKAKLEAEQLEKDKARRKEYFRKEQRNSKSSA